jgi:hypothetical protein
VQIRALSRRAKSPLGVRLLHHFMEKEQLRQLAARVEGGCRTIRTSRHRQPAEQPEHHRHAGVARGL